MKRLHFSTDINAPAAKVWKVLWDDATYREWVAPFSEGSYAVSDWEEGSRILFLSASGEGMFSKIAKKIPEKYMSFEFQGTVKDGVEQPVDEEAREWAGSRENYTLTEENGKTFLEVEVDVTEEYIGHFNDTFPKALAKVKELSEK